MIQLLKLITGEDIIADVSYDALVDKYQLKNPLRFLPTRDGVALAPLVLFAKNDTIEIKGTAVIFTAEPEDEIVNTYNEKFGGIVVPPSGLII
jgi:hypothetical protein